MSSKSEDKAINVKDVLAIVLKRKWLIVIPLVLVTVAAYGGSYLLTPIYESSTIIWIDRPHNVSRELIDIIGREGSQRMSGDERRRQLQALENEITSQAYLVQLIHDLELDTDPEVVRMAAEMREANPDRTLEQLKQYLLLGQLRKRIAVGFVGADQIKITVESTDPTLARDMVKRLTEILEREKTAYEMERILDNQTFADLQLQRTEYEYNLALDSLTTAQTRLSRQQLPANVTSQENRLSILSEIANIEVQAADYAAERQSLSASLEQYGLQNSRLQYTDSLVELRTQVDGQMSSYAAMMETYTWDDQTVVNANIRLNDAVRFMEREIDAAVDRQFGNYEASQRRILGRYFAVNENIDLLDSKVNWLQQALGRLDDRLASIPALQANISELERRVTEARRYRDAFRSEESTVEILSDRVKDRTKYRIIEPARIPLLPVWPDQRKIIVMGLLLGIVIGGAAVFLAEMTDDSFRRVDDVEEMLDLPVLATIPKIEKLRVRR